MSDDTKERPRVIRGSGLVGPDGRTPASRQNQKARKQRPPTIEEVEQWIVAGVLAANKKLYQELYADLAAEHGRVFEVQEAAFMAIAEQLHTRLCVLEESQGVASPELRSLRETVDAIGSYFADVVDGKVAPWSERSPEDRQDIIAQRIIDQRTRARLAQEGVQ